MAKHGNCCVTSTGHTPPRMQLPPFGHGLKVDLALDRVEWHNGDGTFQVLDNVRINRVNHSLPGSRHSDITVDLTVRVDRVYY